MGLWVLGATAYHVLVLGVPRAEIMGVVGFLALAANVASVLLLVKYKDGDANVRSVWLCSRNDAIGNVAVMIAAVAVWATATKWPDLIVAAIMAGLFLTSSAKILKQALAELRSGKVIRRVIARTSALARPVGQGAGVGLFIAAAITTALVLVRLCDPAPAIGRRRPMALAFLVALPLQPLMIYAVRLPIDGLLRTTFGISAGWVTIVSLFYAPLTEEPAKWLTAAVPKVRHAIRRDPIFLALAAGAGFGLGEIWFLAHALIKSPGYPDLPFWMFGGFLLERLAVCFLHGALLVPPFYALAAGRSFLLGGLAGMVVHFLLNFPIYLASINAVRARRDMEAAAAAVDLLIRCAGGDPGSAPAATAASPPSHRTEFSALRDQSGPTPP